MSDRELLLARLRSAGADDEDIDRADAEDRLPTLAVELAAARRLLSLDGQDGDRRACTRGPRVGGHGPAEGSARLRGP